MGSIVVEVPHYGVEQGKIIVRLNVWFSLYDLFQNVIHLQRLIQVIVPQVPC